MLASLHLTFDSDVQKMTKGDCHTNSMCGTMEYMVCLSVLGTVTILIGD